MVAFLLIAQLGSALAVATPPPNYVRPTAPPTAERTPNVYRVPERCKDSTYRVVDRYNRPLPQKLAELPKGALMYAVDRRIDGCPVLVVVYGEAKPDDPNPPPQSYRFAPVPAPAPPATREGAPSNRR
ncbi:MAG: hypothetical protein ACJ798_04185 [Phenylobacterium sp.]